jgi:circadian clock protein KaiC
MTFRITQAGLQTFPRTFGLARESGHIKSTRRVSIGIRELDALMGGGIPDGSSLLLAGPSGSGKSVLASQFIGEGLRHGEPGVVAIFEEVPAEFTRRAAQLGLDFDTPKETARLRSSTSGRWISPSMRRCTKSSAR